MTDPTAAERLDAALDHVMADMGTSEDGCDVVLYAHGQHMISVSGLRGILDENKRLEAENEELADFDRMTTEREKWQGERDRAVQLWHERGKRIKELEAENHRLAEELAMIPGRKKRKLDGGTAREIRAAYAAGGASQQMLAERYGVGQTMISRVILGKAWSGTGEDSTPRSAQ